MLPLKTFALFCAIFALIVCQAQVEAAKNNNTVTTECPPDGNFNDGGDDDGDDDRDGADNDTLCDSFQAIRATIEKNVLVDLIQSHYQCNSKFRKALCYYNTTRFHIVGQQLQHSQTYNMILERLREAGVDTSDIENIVDIFACLQLPTPLPDHSADCRALRGHTFVGDLLAAMPHKAVHAYNVNAHTKHNNFALFVDTVTSKEFQSYLRANLVKRDIARPLRVLRRNGWDVPELLRGVMSVLSW